MNDIIVLLILLKSKTLRLETIRRFGSSLSEVNVIDSINELNPNDMKRFIPDTDVILSNIENILKESLSPAMENLLRFIYEEMMAMKLQRSNPDNNNIPPTVVNDNPQEKQQLIENFYFAINTGNLQLINASLQNDYIRGYIKSNEHQFLLLEILKLAIQNDNAQIIQCIFQENICLFVDADQCASATRILLTTASHLSHPLKDYIKWYVSYINANQSTFLESYQSITEILLTNNYELILRIPFDILIWFFEQKPQTINNDYIQAKNNAAVAINLAAKIIFISNDEHAKEQLYYKSICGQSIINWCLDKAIPNNQDITNDNLFYNYKLLNQVIQILKQNKNVQNHSNLHSIFFSNGLTLFTDIHLCHDAIFQILKKKSEHKMVLIPHIEWYLNSLYQDMEQTTDNLLREVKNTRFITSINLILSSKNRLLVIKIPVKYLILVLNQTISFTTLQHILNQGTSVQIQAIAPYLTQHINEHRFDSNESTKINQILTDIVFSDSVDAIKLLKDLNIKIKNRGTIPALKFYFSTDYVATNIIINRIVEFNRFSKIDEENKINFIVMFLRFNNYKDNIDFLNKANLPTNIDKAVRQQLTTQQYNFSNMNPYSVVGLTQFVTNNTSICSNHPDNNNSNGGNNYEPK